MYCIHASVDRKWHSMKQILCVPSGFFFLMMQANWKGIRFVGMNQNKSIRMHINLWKKQNSSIHQGLLGKGPQGPMWEKSLTKSGKLGMFTYLLCYKWLHNSVILEDYVYCSSCHENLFDYSYINKVFQSPLTFDESLQ